MAHDYTALDAAILQVIGTMGSPSFNTISFAVSRHAKPAAASARVAATEDRIVDRRLQALRKAGRISYQHRIAGWVLVDKGA